MAGRAVGLGGEVRCGAMAGVWSLVEAAGLLMGVGFETLIGCWVWTLFGVCIFRRRRANILVRGYGCSAYLTTLLWPDFQFVSSSILLKPLFSSPLHATYHLHVGLQYRLGTNQRPSSPQRA